MGTRRWVHQVCWKANGRYIASQGEDFVQYSWPPPGISSPNKRLSVSASLAVSRPGSAGDSPRGPDLGHQSRAPSQQKTRDEGDGVGGGEVGRLADERAA